MSRHRKGMVDEDAVQLRPHPENFLRLDVDIGGLSLDAAQRLVDHDPRGGSAKRLPLAPAASSSAPIDAACPMQMVEIAGFTYCIVSYLAMPAVTVNVGRKMIRSLTRAHRGAFAPRPSGPTPPSVPLPCVYLPPL